MVRSRSKTPNPDAEDTLESLEAVVARLERLGDRLEAYIEDKSPSTPEGPHDTPPDH